MNFSDLLILMVIGLILFGPEDLPDVARAVGRIVFEIKKMTGEVTKEFQDAVNTPSNIINQALKESNPSSSSSEQVQSAQNSSESEEELLTYDEAETSTEPSHQDNDNPLSELPNDMLAYQDENKGTSR
ncbi:twin-arginine translocase TatA/TatE family subunit [Desulfitobacterium sp. Sab5]|uniref:twin-arginine translocase TatA/TatE family subunit n=1 Tax=Desulfitobacterium TaxID=36853 RepID=UPI003CF2FF94